VAGNDRHDFKVNVTDSLGVASSVGFWAFWFLLAFGAITRELGALAVAVFLGLWVAGFIGLDYIPTPGSLFPAYVAVLDIALVFAIFKGDVRLG
jgi:hypothetical protein